MNAKRRSYWILVILIAVLLVFVIFAPQYGWELRTYFSPQSGTPPNVLNLAAQNESLAAELAKLSVINAELPNVATGSIRAMVYSRYPFNFKNEILVDAGQNAGVKMGDAVVFEGVFLGQVTSVFSDYAIVQTVFDPNLKMPVRIGKAGYDGLLQGGASPSIASIAPDSSIAVGDVVYSAASGMPYALPIAGVAATSTSPDKLFQTASLNFVYDINEIQTVAILP